MLGTLQESWSSGCSMRAGSGPKAWSSDFLTFHAGTFCVLYYYMHGSGQPVVGPPTRHLQTSKKAHWHLNAFQFSSNGPPTFLMPGNHKENSFQL